MKYFAKIIKQNNGSYFVEFPELPGCLTEGKSLRDAKVNACEALNGWLISNFEREKKIPEAKPRKAKYYYEIEVDLPLSFALRLRQIRDSKGFTQGQIAKKLGISQQAYAKLESPRKSNPSLKTIQKLKDALELEVHLDLVA